MTDPGLQERVARLEGRVGDFASRFDALQSQIRGLQHRMEAGFEAVDRRFESLEGKVDRHFHWLVGINVTVMVSVVGTLVAALFLR